MFSDDKQCSEFLKNLLLDCSVLVLNIVLLQESITKTTAFVIGLQI